MTEYARRLRRSILLWQVLGAFGLSFIYLGIALSRWLSEDWQRVLMWAFMLSLAGALAAGTYVTWKQRRVAKHKPVEKPD